MDVRVDESREYVLACRINRISCARRNNRGPSPMRVISLILYIDICLLTGIVAVTISPLLNQEGHRRMRLPLCSVDMDSVLLPVSLHCVPILESPPCLLSGQVVPCNRNPGRKATSTISMQCLHRTNVVAETGSPRNRSSRTRGCGLAISRHAAGHWNDTSYDNGARISSPFSATRSMHWCAVSLHAT